MILDDMVVNPDKYKGKKLSELTDEEEITEENCVEYGKAYHKKSLIPRMTVVMVFPFMFVAVLFNDYLTLLLIMAENKRDRT